MGRLIVVRHGETDYNLTGRYAGITDIDINETGIDQAKITAEKLQNKNIDAIICSTLERARHTSKIIGEKLCLPVIETQQLNEIHMGVYEGLTKQEAQEKYPQMWRDNNPEGREDKFDVQNRVYNAVNKICVDYHKKTVLIVTHGYISRVIYKYFKNPTDEEFNKYVLHNCAYDEYKF